MQTAEGKKYLAVVQLEAPTGAWQRMSQAGIICRLKASRLTSTSSQHPPQIQHELTTKDSKVNASALPNRIPSARMTVMDQAYWLERHCTTKLVPIPRLPIVYPPVFRWPSNLQEPKRYNSGSDGHLVLSPAEEGEYLCGCANMTR